MFLLSTVAKDLYIKNLNVEVALTAAKYPASGSFIDVSRLTRFGFLIPIGSLDTAITAKVQQDTSATQTANIKDITGATEVIADTDDGKWAGIEVETDHLDGNNGFRYVTLDVAGPAGGNDYGAILFYGVPIDKPAVQPAAGGPISGSPVVVAG